MKLFDQWVAVWWPGFATLLPSNRKTCRSNFFLFMLTVCNVGILLVLLFIIWVIFPDISFKQRNITSSPSRPLTSINQFKLWSPIKNAMECWPKGWSPQANRIRDRPLIWPIGFDHLADWIWAHSEQIPSFNQHNDKQMTYSCCMN